MYNISKYFISLFGTGFFPFASGTVGSFFSIIFFYFVKDYISIFILLLFFFIIFFMSIYSINLYSLNKKNVDASEIVIDEFLGIYLIILFYDYIKFMNDIMMFLLIFFLFRFFDITKIYPANWIDKNIKNSYGVILDDLVAGFYCILVLLTVNAFI